MAKLTKPNEITITVSFKEGATLQEIRDALANGDRKIISDINTNNNLMIELPLENRNTIRKGVMDSIVKGFGQVKVKQPKVTPPPPREKTVDERFSVIFHDRMYDRCLSEYAVTSKLDVSTSHVQDMKMGKFPWSENRNLLDKLDSVFGTTPGYFSGVYANIENKVAEINAKINAGAKL